jgi:AcrR family transcriptional regulator
MRFEAGKRPGRPVGADSERTHYRILDAARGVFAEDGYATAQNRRIAARASVATSTMYHYFSSKLDLYVMVFRDAEAQVAARYRDAIAEREAAVDRLVGILDAAEGLYAEDPSITHFLAMVPTEMRSHADLARAIAACPVTLKDLIRSVLESAATRGELRDGVDIDGVTDLFAATTVGIAQFGRAGDVEEYGRMLDAMRSLTRGAVFV